MLQYLQNTKSVGGLSNSILNAILTFSFEIILSPFSVRAVALTTMTSSRDSGGRRCFMAFAPGPPAPGMHACMHV